MSTAQKNALAILICAVSAVAVAFGIRQSFGLFMAPMAESLGWGRETISLIFAVVALLNGLAAPIIGIASDRWGAGWTVTFGGLFYALGLLTLGSSTSPMVMTFGAGILIGIGVSACGLPVMLAVIGKIAPEEKRSMWLGLVAAGSTLGQLGLIPTAHYLVSTEGWQTGIYVLAGLIALVVPIGLFFNRLSVQPKDREEDSQTLSQAVNEARTHRGYWLLVSGFFVCGFQVQFVALHLPAYISDSGLSPSIGAASLTIIALANMFGAAYAGYLGGKYRKRTLLSLLYLGRGVLIACFVVIPLSDASVLVFSALMGFMWLGTVPLTSGVVAQIFGPRYMTTLFAVVYLSHQLGNFAGAWLGGYVFDTTGSYELVWWFAAALGFIAAGLNAPLDDRPLTRNQLTTHA